MLRILMTLLLLIASSYLLLLVCLFTLQEKLIFHPTLLQQDERFTFSVPFEEHWVESHKATLNVLRFITPNPKGKILYFHGNAGSLAEWGEVVKDFNSFPYELWIYDYRGFGKSTGTVTDEMSLHRDAEAIYRYMVKHGENQEIIFYGRSLGTGIASKLALKFPPALLILETPYFSFEDLAQQLYPFVPSFLVKYKLRTDQVLPQLSIPIHLLHGMQDELIPFSSSERLSELGRHITLHRFQTATHNTVSHQASYPLLLKQLFNRPPSQ